MKRNQLLLNASPLAMAMTLLLCPITPAAAEDAAPATAEAPAAAEGRTVEVINQELKEARDAFNKTTQSHRKTLRELGLDKDPAYVEANTAARDANMAVGEAIREVTASDPEGKALLDELEALREQIKAETDHEKRKAMREPERELQKQISKKNIELKANQTESVKAAIAARTAANEQYWDTVVTVIGNHEGGKQWVADRTAAKEKMDALAEELKAARKR